MCHFTLRAEISAVWTKSSTIQSVMMAPWIWMSLLGSGASTIPARK